MSAMLASLRIRNLALAEDVFWEPTNGFNAISGETGAGKSVILGALNLILGERLDRNAIRSGAESCSVEAEFQLDDLTWWNAILSDQNAEPCIEGVCIMRRTLHINGTSRNFLNGSPCTLSLLREVGKHLVDLHGPYEHQSLFSNHEQAVLLDAFAGASEQRKAVANVRQKFLRLTEEQTQLTESLQSREREIDILLHQIQEISSAHLSTGEEEALLEQQRIFVSAQRIQQAIRELQELIEGEQGIVAFFLKAVRVLRDWERIDSRASVLLERHKEIAEKIDEWWREIDHLNPEESAISDPKKIEERIDLLQFLKRKYGSSIAEVLAFAEKSQARLDGLNQGNLRKDSLEKELKQARAELEHASAELTRRRKVAVPKLQKLVTRHLQDLGFRQAEFSIKLEALSQVSATGLEKIEFLFAPNPGEPPLPLRSIASSGEISRVLLALKAALVDEDQIPILVFDEIDSNVGGEIATMVGTKIRDIAKRKQVLCISHLPQVAALANTHFVVEKKVKQGRSYSLIREICSNDRVHELARMLGGKATSAAAHARSLLESPL